MRHILRVHCVVPLPVYDDDRRVISYSGLAGVGSMSAAGVVSRVVKFEQAVFSVP